MPSNQDLNAHVRSSQRVGSIAFTIETRDAECVVSRMPISEGVLNPFGSVQAGAMIWLADVTASVLAIGDRQFGPDGQGFPLAVNLNTTLVANQAAGDITAEARFVRKGRRFIVIRTVIKGDAGRFLAEITSTHVPA